MGSNLFQIGASSDLLRSLPIGEAIRTMRELGAEGIEIWLGHLDQDDPLEVRKLLRREGLNYRVHADVRDVNLTSTNRGIREESLRQMLAALETAERLEAPVLTMHPGRMSSSKDRPEQFWPLLIEQMSVIADKAKACGVIVGVENMERRAKEFVLTMADINRLLNEVDHPFLGHTLDVAHAHSVEDAALFLSRVDYSRVVNVHVSQAARRKMHLPMSRGEIRMSEALSQVCRGYDGLIVIESYLPGNEREQLKHNLEVLNGYRREIAVRGQAE